MAFAEADEAAGGAAEVAVLPLPALLPPLFWLLPPLAGKAGALGGVGALGNCGWPVRTPLLKSWRIDRRWVRTLLNSFGGRTHHWRRLGEDREEDEEGCEGVCELHGCRECTKDDAKLASESAERPRTGMETCRCVIG